ncbi:putative leucine-rich repeat domain superfamily [Helianthus annuus]|nr:putative leucine-rich repeat domain superfamily [Helianthus annuus]KAJ0499415.1 putative leucine-rich repeat domain superfamily [Helianthus annuus]KAJ0665435.1 putative leucine-rich repeat domain superfamily [Helianthus annuus]
MRFVDMHGWKKWTGAVFPRLKKLEIKGCPNLVEATLDALPSLNVLNLLRCDSGMLRSLVEVASGVTKLEIERISGLNDVVWGGVTESLGAVEELSIRNCNEIRYLVKSDADASKILVTLRKLEVLECDNLVSLGEKEEEDNCRSNILSSLRILNVYNCKNMERCNCPDGIEELDVHNCSSTVVSFPKGRQVKLRRLQIYNCRKLLERELGGQKMNNRSSMQMLEYVNINNLPNLKSITELNFLVHLTQLVIMYCESLEFFPDNLTSLKKLQIIKCPKLKVSFLRDNLTSLENLVLLNCPSTDVSLPGWVWPPNLRSLETGELKKPISEWGPQNFPTSLVELKLHDDEEDGVSSCSQLSHILPSSLTSLQITGFQNLESVTEGLQHFISLQHLAFFGCPNLKNVSLPQHLTSLQQLTFERCPELKRVCSHPQHLTSLQHLYFWNCPKMMELPEIEMQ